MRRKEGRKIKKPFFVKKLKLAFKKDQKIFHKKSNFFQDRAKHMTPEERKKMIKDLIDKIPTGKDELFAYQIQWDHVDQKLVENRIQPWVNRKIRDYLGEDEPALANFIGEKIAAHVEPTKLLTDLALVRKMPRKVPF